MTSPRRWLVLLVSLVLLPLAAAATAYSAGPTAAVAGSGPLFRPLDGFRQPDGQASVRPADYRAYRVDLADLRARLAGGGSSTLSLPAPTGELVRFRVAEDSVMEPELQAAHPETRTYAGSAPDGSSIRFDVTPLGFHAFVRRPDGRAWYLDPAQDRVGEERVLSYFGAAVPRAAEAFRERDVVGAAQAAAAGGAQDFAAPGGTVSTRTYRLAFLTDPTYAAYFGGTDSAVLAAKTTLVNRVNEVYNDDLAIRFTLVNGTDTELNLGTVAEATGADGPCGADPCFQDSDLESCSGDTLDRNEFVLGQLVGAENFDLGHIGLGVNGGGIAGLGVVGGTSKAAGCTGLPKPDGDFYAIDYVAHEVGHQMGADHTFNGTQLNCSAGNRNLTPFATQVEPGSGSSIMAYAGICQQDNLQSHSDPYFSFASVDQVNATTAASPTTADEEQVVSFLGLDAGETFTLSCTPACGTSSAIGITGNPLTDLPAIAGAVSTATGVTVTPVEVSGYDGGATPSPDGFTVDFQLLGSGTDVKTLTVTPVTGTFTAKVGTIHNGGPGTNQGTVAATADKAPVVTAPADKTLPIRTPFTLTGSATDPDGDPLTYLWEQTDAGGLSGTSLVSNAKSEGPLFRQFGVAAAVSPANALLYHSPGENLAGSSPSRTFPDLAQVLAGNTNARTGACPAAPPPPASGGGTNVPAATIDCYSEFLPTDAWVGSPLAPGVLHFRLTARDEFTPDAAGDHAGGLSSDDVALKLDPGAGPFLVTSRRDGGVASGAETVTWRVAGTDTAALAKDVRISLSTDGGLTWPTVLAASTPNDGSQTVVLPPVATTAARLKVEAVGNYFFAVNDANFSIGTPLADGRGRFASAVRSSTLVPGAHGPARFRFAVGRSGADLGGLATFRFKKGKIAFVGGDVVSARVSGRRSIRFTVVGTNRGKAGYKLVVRALDKGSRKGAKDKIRVRVFKGKKLVYDSMRGAKTTSRPRTPVKGHITVD